MQMPRRRLVLAAGVGLGLAAFGVLVSAQSVAHPNTLAIVPEDGNNLAFQFSLNVPQVLHQLLSPSTPFPAFLQNYAHMPPAAWAAALQKAQAKLASSGVLTLPGARPIRLQSWQWPDPDAMAQSIKAQELILQMAEQSRPHLDPVRVLAHLQTPGPIHQAQLQLPSALYPIEVSIKTDTFWLTSQIPLARVTFP
jgi:hypothetical protein